MPAWLVAYQRLNDVVQALVTILAMAIVAFVVAALFGGSVVRYFTGIGYDWVLELPPQLLPWLVFPMTGVLLRRDQHVTVDVLPAYVEAPYLVYVRIFAFSVSALGCAIFTYAGTDALIFFIGLGQMAQTEISFPLWYLYLSFPVGFGLAANFCLEALLLELHARHVRRSLPLSE